MSPQAAFGYCQARLQARYADLPGEAEWQRLAGARTLAAFLAEARGGRLQPWVKGFSGQSTDHDLERGLRALATDAVNEVTNWVPDPWQPAVAWVAWVPYLPVLEHLAQAGSRPPPWAVTDGRFSTLLDAAGAPDRAALGQAGLLPLVSAGQPTLVAVRWAETWRALWPRCDRACRGDLDGLTERIADHLRAFRRASPGTAWDLRQTLRERLRLDFHRHLLAPVTPFIYLGMVLLDLEQLRAKLLRRALFSPGFLLQPPSTVRTEAA